jgi:hypothetical protein
VAAIRLYFDEDSMAHGLLQALRARGIDAVSAEEEGRRSLTDLAQLEWATAHNRVLYIKNAANFQRLHTAILVGGHHHAGIIILTKQGFSIGDQLRALLRLHATRTSEDMLDSLAFLNNWR